MANLAVRFSVVLTGFLILGSFIMNGWIRKELESPLNIEPSTFVRIEEPEQPREDNEYDVDFSGDLAGPANVEITPERMLIRKLKRARDEKIIYEMPTSNKFLLQ